MNICLHSEVNQIINELQQSMQEPALDVTLSDYYQTAAPLISAFHSKHRSVQAHLCRAFER